MKSKLACIFGVTGQDGAYLCRSLIKNRYNVVGLLDKKRQSDLFRLDHLGIKSSLRLHTIDCLCPASIDKLFRDFKFTEVYNLAGQSNVSISWDNPDETYSINTLLPHLILESIKTRSNCTKFFQASSSEIFGECSDQTITEISPFKPNTPYGVSKLIAHEITRYYRQKHNLFACNGILFNHESPLRGSQFVSKKIVRKLVEVHLGLTPYLEIGNLNSKRDWSSAEDFVEGFRSLMSARQPTDVIFATGRHTTVRELINIAADHLNMSILWRGTGSNEIGLDSKTSRVIVKVNEQYFRPEAPQKSFVSTRKAMKLLGWQSTTDLGDLIKRMIEHELKELEMKKTHQTGKRLL